MPWIGALAGADQAGVRAQPFAALEAARPRVEIRNAAGDDGDEAEMLMYAPVGGWFGIWAEDVVAELKQITAPNLRVRVNSPGGSVFEGIAIANALRAHPATVTVQVDSLAASIASVIAMAGDRVVMMPGSQIMVHDASAVTYGNAAEMRELADLLDKQSDNIADQYAARAGGTRDDWRAVMRDETWYLADEAVEQGLADEVLAAPAPEEEPAEPGEGPDMKTWAKLFGFRYTGREEAPAPAAVAAQSPAAPSAPPAVVDLEKPPTAPAPAPAPADGFMAQFLAACATVGLTPTATAAPPAPEPETIPGPGEPPVDEWAAATAHLTDPPADDWSAAIAHLTDTTPAPCSAATDA